MSDLSLQAQTNLIEFTKGLIAKGIGVFHDRYGCTKIEIGHGVLRNRLDQIKHYYLVSQDESKTAIMNYGIDKNTYQESKHPDKNTLLSIGTFDTHNHSKQSRGHLITVPVPLTNDSFCTDRCNPPKGGASFRCRFPDEIIIDLDLLNRVPFEVHRLGLGEFIGIYYSIIDYSKSRNKPLPVKLLDYISDLSTVMSKHINENEQNIFLRYLGSGLVLKCCIMRQANDHEIGCCGDHMIASVLEDEHQLPHGQAVFYGALMLAMLFPEWERFDLQKKKLIEIGKTASLFDPEFLQIVNRTPNLIENAIRSRPSRLTMLRNVLNNKF